MAGIYLHIPFCKQACTYCDFHFSTSLTHKPALLSAMHRELEQCHNAWQGQLISTVYFGGGTPSLLSAEELHDLLTHIRALYTVDPEAEITLEANPDDIHDASLAGWRKAGINRLSVGLQALDNEVLQFMNRAHTMEDSLRTLETVPRYFDNYSVDFIYGVPQTAPDYWPQLLDKIARYRIPHLSCYGLTVEPRTKLHNDIRAGRIPEPDEAQMAREFQQWQQWLKAQGYEHYEISNAALPGMRSRHNSAYWKGIPYLGIGPAAHSFQGHTRRYNIASNMGYIQKISGGKPYWESEELSAKDRFNEAIMIGLRTVEGVNIRTLAEDTGFEIMILQKRQLDEFFRQDLLNLREENLRITEKGKLFVDRIASELFLT